MRTNVHRVAKTLNHEGTPVKRLAAEKELRRAVMSSMLFENDFYEDGESIAARISGLVGKLPANTVSAIASEARNKMKLRHMPLFLARELARNHTGSRVLGDLLYDIIQRPDELSEFLSLYWKEGKKPIAKQVKLGLARAFRKFDEYALAKYNRDSAISLRDVLFMVHAKPKDAAQNLLWKRLIDGQLVTPDTWEVALSGGADKKAAFERLIAEGKLGALALLRNLRGMREAGVSDGTLIKALSTMKVDKVLPFRFITAARYAPTLEPALEAAMLRCLSDQPKLPGKTALIVDTSPSMWMAKVSAKSEMDRFDAAAALAILCREVCEDVNVYAFNRQGYEVAPRHGFALRDALLATKGDASCGGAAVMMANKAGYDRVICLTDGEWHQVNERGGFSLMGEAKLVSPAPLTDKAYMLNVGSTRNGVGYGKWTSIDGWSEAVIEYIRASEGVLG